jgi:hypothetical protein
VKACLITTGTVFGLLTLAHLWRLTVEPHPATDPYFLLTTVVSAALGLWAWRLLRLSSRLGVAGA